VADIALTPCVFCGSEPALWTEEDGNHMITDAWVECDRCHAKGPIADTEIDAAAKWNVPGVYIRMLKSGSVVSQQSPQGE
jgi:Lar family restriction alleviation protein